MFFRRIDGGKVGFPLPSKRDDVDRRYVRKCRIQFRPTAEDGVSDDDFYQ